jgi:hypothetical protein
MKQVLLFLCLNLVSTWGLSAWLKTEWSTLFCASISSWMLLDRLLVQDCDEIIRLREENCKLKQEVLLAQLDLKRLELKQLTLKTLKGSSCKF